MSQYYCNGCDTPLDRVTDYCDDCQQVRDDAQEMFDNLDAHQLLYIQNEVNPFSALHDLCDANMLFPRINEEYDNTDECIDRLNRVSDCFNELVVDYNMRHMYQ